MLSYQLYQITSSKIVIHAYYFWFSIVYKSVQDFQGPQHQAIIHIGWLYDFTYGVTREGPASKFSWYLAAFSDFQMARLRVLISC